MKKKVFVFVIILFMLTSNISRAYSINCNDLEIVPYDIECEPVEITISAAGDCTIGYDEEFGYFNSYDDVINKMGVDHPFKNVLNIFNADDITVVNLETTLTNAENKAVKEFRFKGKPEYVRILSNSSIECVNISNNHTHDYLEQGYKDTIDNLEKAKIGYFGDGYIYSKEVKGIKVGFLGFKGWDNEQGLKKLVKSGLDELKQKMGCKIAVVSFHWGIERENYPSNMQTELGRYAVDCGADLVLGHHPHVIQGIEEYKGRHIVYSMGNFSYGGHKNPADKDTFIFVEKFKVCADNVDLQETHIIPCSISSITERNNYQPTPLYEDDGKRVQKRLQTYSLKLPYGYDVEKIIDLNRPKPVTNYPKEKRLIEKEELLNNYY